MEEQSELQKVTFKTIYQIFKQRYPAVKIKRTRFLKTLRVFFRNAREYIMNGNVFNLKNQLGYVNIYKEDRSLVDSYDETKKLVDFGATRIRAKFMTPEQIANREHIVYVTHLSFPKIRWVKWQITSERQYLPVKQRNVRFFSFKPSRLFKLLVGSMASTIETNQRGNFFALDYC